MLVTEDRMFHKTTYEEFQHLMNDMIKYNVSYMPIGKLFKYTSGSKYKNIEEIPSIFNLYEDGGEHLWLFKAKNSPGKSFSVDAIYKRELIINLLEEILYNYGKNESFNHYYHNTPHYFEDYYAEEYGNSVRKRNNMVCAVPKREIIVSDETPGFKRFTK